MEVQDEATALRRALQEIDGWDTDVTALFGLEDVVPSPPPARKRRNRQRLGDKQERIELQQQLDTLQRHIASRGAAFTPSQDVDGLWEEIALRQRELRFAAQVENTKLRKVVEDDYKASSRLSVLACKASAIGTALGASTEARLDKDKCPRLDVSTHLKRLDGLAQDAHDVFSSDLYTSDRDFRDVTVKNIGDAGFMLELTASWALPFALERVVDALWVQTTRMPRKEKSTHFQDLYASDGRLVSQFVSQAKVLGTIAGGSVQQPHGWSTHGQIATRREPPTPAGIVLVVSNMDAINYGEDGTCRSLLQGNGFLLVEPLQTSTAAPMCRVKWCRRMQGCARDTSAEAKAEHTRWAQDLTSRVMSKQWRTSIEQSLQAVENTLFDGAHGDQRLARPSCVAASVMGAASG